VKRAILLYMLGLLICHGTCAQTDSLTMSLKGQTIRAFELASNSDQLIYAGLKGSTLGTGLVYKSMDAGLSWHPMNGGLPLDPYVADVQAIASSNFNSTTLWAGTWKSGLFKSENGGQSWTKDVHFPSADIRSIRTGKQHPNLIYASTSAFGVVKSIDGGKHWKRSSAAMIDSTFAFAWNIELDPRDDEIIYAQTFGRGVWKSTDQGEHWSQVLDTEGKVCWDMKIINDDIWVATSKRGDSLSVVYHSTDAGNSWTELPDAPQIGVNQINVLDVNDKQVLIIGSWQDGVYINQAGKWSKAEGIDFDTIAHILVIGNKVLVGSWGNGIYQLDFTE